MYLVHIFTLFLYVKNKLQEWQHGNIRRKSVCTDRQRMKAKRCFHCHTKTAKGTCFYDYIFSFTIKKIKFKSVNKQISSWKNWFIRELELMPAGSAGLITYQRVSSESWFSLTFSRIVLVPLKIMYKSMI